MRSTCADPVSLRIHQEVRLPWGCISTFGERRHQPRAFMANDLLLVRRWPASERFTDANAAHAIRSKWSLCT